MHCTFVHSLYPFSHRSTAAAVALALTLGTTSQAGVVRYYADGQMPDPAVVANILGKGKPVHRMKMRGGSAYDEPAAAATDGGIAYRDDVLAREQQLSVSAQSAVQSWQARLAGAAADAAPAAPAPSSMKATALAVAVNFENDSARLPPAALPMLDAIAQGMRQAGFARPFVIEGHTSATGSAAHNLLLSRQRAQSVKRYLVQRQQLPATALRTVGLGPRVPLDPTNPSAAANRRVQFRAG